MCWRCEMRLDLVGAANVVNTAASFSLAPQGAAELMRAANDAGRGIAWGLLHDLARDVEEGCLAPSSAIERAAASLLCWALCREEASCLGTDARTVAPSSRKMILSGSTLTYETSSRGCLRGRRCLLGSATTAAASPARRTKTTPSRQRLVRLSSLPVCWPASSARRFGQ